MGFNLTDIILVNEFDEEIGTGEKLMVHQKGLLHRAFSVLIFNEDNELLIHKRALHKYHSGGLWTNTCCGQPNADEEIGEAAYRRLGEEMGFNTDLSFLFKFHYKTSFENGLIENEIDHVFVGNYNGTFYVNKEEVSDFKWVSIGDILDDVDENPQAYTFWFKEILKSEEFGKFTSRQLLFI